MRRHIWLLWLGAAFFVIGCGAGAPPQTPDHEVVVHDNVRLLEDVPTFQNVTVEQEQLIYEFGGPTDDLEVEVGDVVVGNGYLRRVESVTRDGNKLNLGTSLTATLMDVFQKINYREVIGPEDFTRMQQEYESRYGTLEQPLDLIITLPLSGISINFELDDGDGGKTSFKVTFLSGSEIRFGPSIIWVLDWETPPWYLLWDISRYKLNEFKVGLRGQFDESIDVEYELSGTAYAEAKTMFFNYQDKGPGGTVTDKLGILKREPPSWAFNFMIGPVPVRMKIVFNTEIGVSVEASGAIRATVGEDMHAYIETGVRYTNGWGAFFDSGFQGGYHEPTPSGNPPESFEVKFKVWLKPIFTLSIYEIGGPFLALELYLEAILKFIPEFCFEMQWGVKGAVGLKTEGWISDLFNLVASLEREFNLYGPKKFVSTCTQTGNLEGKVVVWNTDPDVPIEGATIDIYKPDGTKVGQTLTSDAEGLYKKEGLAAGDYRIHVYKAGYLPADVSVEVKPEQTVYVTELKALTDACDCPGVASGDVVDATTKQGIPGVHLDFRAGVDMKTGDIVASTDTDGSGRYRIEGLDSGNYTAQAHKDGYADSFFNIVVCGTDDGDPNNDEIADQRGTMVPLDGNWHIRLEWGSKPNDLDLHCLTPDGHHIFFRDVSKDGHEAHCKGDKSGPPWIALDVDHTKGYGPETLTLTQWQSGTYTIFVHNYGHHNTHEYEGGTYADENTPLTNSQAKVRVDRAGEEVEMVSVPSSGGGYFWHVMTIDGSDQSINVQNTIDSSGQNPHDYIDPVTCLE
ncbi:MAG: carboxypeptidase regulatory-like domain-containing protein [Deltaproteobacteria bacterium]|nr:carboxypeptidase regulatory-like domain-containing protein [Deltaproteobacteria bacterium]